MACDDAFTLEQSRITDALQFLAQMGVKILLLGHVVPGCVVCQAGTVSLDALSRNARVSQSMLSQIDRG